MGEIADMMIEGVLCEGCGVAMDGPPDGYPRKCKDCRRAAQAHAKANEKCGLCGKKVKFGGLQQHVRDVHGQVGEGK